MHKIKIKPLLFWTLSAVAVGALSGVLTMRAMDHYANVKQPPLSPPGWLFPIVWTALFLLMGVSAYIIWTKDDAPENERKEAIIFYCLQLAVNFFWPIVFFNEEAYLFALIWLVLLIVLVGVMISRFRALSRAAARLNIPYFIWLLFAAYLNAGVWWLNR
ncbi:MAG: tryptophan-rich sensory protein [Clostridia bacterium]|nr:tryptophan-rich sensory protein [Clostridia bacterium]